MGRVLFYAKSEKREVAALLSAGGRSCRAGHYTIEHFEISPQRLYGCWRQGRTGCPPAGVPDNDRRAHRAPADDGLCRRCGGLQPSFRRGRGRHAAHVGRANMARSLPQLTRGPAVFPRPAIFSSLRIIPGKGQIVFTRLSDRERDNDPGIRDFSDTARSDAR
jgi:hypothetical protein